MFNLAGVPEPISSKLCLAELSAASVPAVRLDKIPRAEVPSTVIGLVYFPQSENTVTFTRAWYYWVVVLSKALPHAQALKLNKQWSEQVRVDGYAGGTEPGETGVFTYHVDTDAGLAALQKALIETFGQPQLCSAGSRLPYLNREVLAPARPEILVQGLCELADYSCRSENKALYLLAALEAAETKGLNQLLPELVDKLNEHYRTLLEQLQNRRRWARRNSNDYFGWLMDVDDCFSKLKVLRQFAPSRVTAESSSERRQRTRRHRTIEKLLKQQLREYTQNVIQAKEESEKQYPRSRVALVLVWMHRIRLLLSKNGDSQLKEARRLCAELHDYERETVTRLPESPTWEKYQGKLARALHQANAYCNSRG